MRKDNELLKEVNKLEQNKFDYKFCIISIVISLIIILCFYIKG